MCSTGRFEHMLPMSKVLAFHFIMEKAHVYHTQNQTNVSIAYYLYYVPTFGAHV